MLRWLWLSVLVIVLDQWSKTAVENSFMLYERLPVTSFFNLTLAYNKGAAFSFLADAGGWQQFFFIGLAVLVCGYLIYFLRTLSAGLIALPLGVAMIIGGALGNVIDRLLYGHVIDFLDFYIHDWHWPVFNLADSAITLGVILFIWDSFFGASAKADQP